VGQESNVRSVRVLLADDHPVLLAGLRRLLSDEFELVGAVADGQALVALAQKLRPDVIVVDISMPGMNGLEAARRIRRVLPETKFMVLSVHSESVYVEEAFRVGVRAYVLKQSPPEELFTALRAVVAGRTYVTPLIENQPTQRQPRLTSRQLAVLELVADGLQNKEIAQKLHITVKTVEYHKRRLMDQLSIRTAAGLTRYALGQGTLSREKSR